LNGEGPNQDGTARRRACFIRWRRGGDAEIVALSANAIELRSSVSWPPGAPVEGVLKFDGTEEAPIPVRVKVYSCRSDPGSGYLVKGRALDMSRGLRQRILERFNPSDGKAAS
jgi:hypothetical protein